MTHLFHRTSPLYFTLSCTVMCSNFTQHWFFFKSCLIQIPFLRSVFEKYTVCLGYLVSFVHQHVFDLTMFRGLLHWLTKMVFMAVPWAWSLASSSFRESKLSSSCLFFCSTSCMHSVKERIFASCWKSQHRCTEYTDEPRTWEWATK